MGGLERRLEDLEGRIEPPEKPERADIRARMKAVLDEIAAARRQGSAPSEAARAVMEANERRRSREPA